MVRNWVHVWVLDETGYVYTMRQKMFKWPSAARVWAKKHAPYGFMVRQCDHPHLHAE